MKPKVSVIVPNFNHSRFLSQRIDSILNQTFQDFELILLDDCSNDESLQVLQEYEVHPKVSKVLYNEQNSGSTFKQWEKGISVSGGEFIWIAESDDWAEPTFLERAYGLMFKNQDLGLVSCNSNWVDVEGFIIGVCTHDCFKKEIDYTMKGKDFFMTFMLIGNSISNASAVLFRKEAITFELSLIMPYRLCGDWLFWSLIMMGKDVGIIPDCLSNFRQHKKTVRATTDLKKEKAEIIKALNEVLKRARFEMKTKQTIYDSFYLQMRNEGFLVEYLENASNDPKIFFRKWLRIKHEWLKKMSKLKRTLW